MKIKNVMAVAGGFVVGVMATGAGYVIGRAAGYKMAMEEVEVMSRLDEAIDEMNLEVKVTEEEIGNNEVIEQWSEVSKIDDSEVVEEYIKKTEAEKEKEILDKELEAEDNEIEQELENK